jgi:hypothetical protein
MQSLAGGDGISLIRWLLHLVLPYPSFLIDAEEIGLICRLEPKWMAEHLQDDSDRLSKWLKSCRYRGILSDFLGRRWWRPAVVEKLRGITNGRPHDTSSLRLCLAKLAEITPGDLPFLSYPTPVRLVDEDFRFTSEVCDVEDAVRVEPEEWPSELSPPWITLRQVIQSQRLQRYVIERDIDRVHGHSQTGNE